MIVAKKAVKRDWSLCRLNDMTVGRRRGRVPLCVGIHEEVGVLSPMLPKGAEHIRKPACERRRKQSHRRPGTEQKPKPFGSYAAGRQGFR